MSILDMPNIEGEQSSNYFDPLMTAGRASTEPVVEMYDSDTSFDAADQTNFEKNMEFIYSQISRRALNQSRLMSRKDVPVENELNNMKVFLKINLFLTELLLNDFFCTVPTTSQLIHPNID